MKPIFAIILFALSSNLFAADIEAGKAKSATCVACHGAAGVAAVPTFPNLAGQNEPYLVSALKAYRDGQRAAGNAAVMAPMAKALSDEDIANLAAYYSSLK